MSKKSINILDKDYIHWVKELSSRYRKNQIKAAVKVNSEMLRYYWELGRDIVTKQAESKWGSGFFNQLSLDMKAEFPNEKGFSSANMRYMKRWYDFYYQRVVIRQRPVEELEMPQHFGMIPWGQHIEIFTRCNIT